MTTAATEEQREDRSGNVEDSLGEGETEPDTRGQQVDRGGEGGSGFHILLRSLNSAKGCNKKAMSHFSLNF